MIEVKTRRGRQSADQLEFEREWIEHGGTYIVARSVEDVEQALRYFETTGSEVG